MARRELRAELRAEELRAEELRAELRAVPAPIRSPILASFGR